MIYPKVSIIMATYNRSDLILGTLQSITAQTATNWECIIINDGGTDDTIGVISDIISRDSRFKYLDRPITYKKGLPGSRNYGLDLAKGDLIVFYDDDDIIHPQNLELCLEVFEKFDIDFCSYYKKPFFNGGEPLSFEKQELQIQGYINSKDIEAIVKNEIALASCTVVWRKSCFLHQKFNEDLMYAEEWECFSRIIVTGKNGICLSNILYFNRKHSSSNTGEFRKRVPIRVDSKIEAVKLVVTNIAEKNLLTPGLIKHFIRIGYTLNNHTIIQKVLEASKAGKIRKIKFKIGFIIYPVIRPFLIIKGKWLNAKRNYLYKL